MTGRRSTNHVSDCAFHADEACDCGGLDLAIYEAEDFRPTLIPSTGRFGFFVDHSGGECFIEEHSLPTGTLIAIAAAAHLIDAHAIVAGGQDANSMDLNYSKEAVIAKLKALALA